MNDGRFDSEAALRAVHALARRAIIFDMEKAAEQAGTVNQRRPVRRALRRQCARDRAPAFRAAIKMSGKSLDANIRGFEIGFAAARGDMPDATQIGGRCIARCRGRVPGISVETRYTIDERVRRCQDYQNVPTPEGYIAKVRELTALDRRSKARPAAGN